MALFGMELKRRRKRASGLLSTYDVNVSGKDMKRHGVQSSARSLGRFTASWAALSLGLFTCYTAMHYAPAIVDFKQVIGEGGPGPSKSKSLAMADGGKNVLSPYLEMFELDRTYLRAGQAIRAEYDVPTSGAVALSVVKCESALVVEVFRCKPVGSSDVVVTGRAGAKEFRFAEAGFYHVYDDAKGNPDLDYRVVWSRG